MLTQLEQFRISICIPTYNRASFLQESLSSIIQQVERCNTPIEIIVSDNASIDNTEEVALELREKYPYIRYFKNPKNYGPCANIKLSIDRANGRYIWLFSDDDRLRDGAVYKVLRVLEDNPSIGYIFIARELHNHDFRERCEVQTFNIYHDQYFENGKALYAAGGGKKRLGEILGYISSTVFLKELWVTSVERVEVDWTSTFAHLYIILYFIRNCPCFYIATPYVLVRTGNKSDYCYSRMAKSWFEDLENVYSYARLLGFDASATNEIKKQIFRGGVRVLLADRARGFSKYPFKDIVDIVDLPLSEFPLVTFLALIPYYVFPQKLVMQTYRVYRYLKRKL